MSFDLPDEFGKGGAGLTTPFTPGVKVVLEALGNEMDGLNLAEVDGVASGTALENVFKKALVSGATANSDISVSDIETNDLITSVVRFVGVDGTSPTLDKILSVDLAKVSIDSTGIVHINLDTSDDLVFITFADVSEVG